MDKQGLRERLEGARGLIQQVRGVVQEVEEGYPGQDWEYDAEMGCHMLEVWMVRVMERIQRGE
jgi:hypothetical protein